MDLIKKLAINAGIALLISSVVAFLLWIVFVAAVATITITGNVFLTLWVALFITALMVSLLFTFLTYSKPIEVQK